MKIKKEYIVLIALALILSLYLVFNNAGKMNYSIPVLDKTEKGVYAHIVIEKNGSAITLDRSNDLWRLGSDSSRADKTAVDNIIENLSDLFITDMVAKSGNLKTYGLAGEDVIHVTASDKDNKTLRELYIGKLTTGRGFTYIKLNDDKNVYTVKGNIRDSFDISADGITDKKILAFDSSSILKISIKANGTTTVFTKEEKDGKDVWKNKSGDTIETEMVSNNLKALTEVEFTSHSEKKPDTAAATLTLSDKDGIYTLAISPKTENIYIGTSSYAERPFILDEKTGDAIMRAFDELSGKPVKK